MKILLTLLALAGLVGLISACRRSPHAFKPMGDKPDPANIVPRLKGPGFLKFIAELHPKPESTPVTEPFVGDLYVTYALDLPEMFQMFSAGNMQELGMTKAEVRSVAIANLRKQVTEIKVDDMGPIKMLITGNDLEACLLLLDDIWEPYTKLVSGELVVGVPTREVVMFTGTDSKLGMQVLREAVEEAYRKDTVHCLTRNLLVRRNGKWEVLP